MNLSIKTIALASAIIASSTPAMSASVADIAFVIDQSGSMNGEFSWLSSSIDTISQGISDAGITARYAVAGYERDFGANGYYADTNVYQDFTSDISVITGATSNVTTYGGSEYSYNAAVDATTGFSWSDSAASVIILITDETSPQYGDTYSEVEVGNIMNSGDFLLNVIAQERDRSHWDEAAYSTDSYLGFFDINNLRDNASDFTAQFTAAKITEIINAPAPTPVPVPAAVWLFVSGLLGLVGFQRRKASI
ncbi:MAG: VWA domain-containing protein [Candidatus Thiodiazotropha sp.]|jgi:hypothetical protein